MNTERRIYLTSMGCLGNQLDGSKYQMIFEQHGYTVTRNYRKADLIAVNTCGYSQKREDEVIEKIKYLKLKKRSDAEMIVCGCLPKINPERLREIFDGVSFGPKNPSKLAEYLNTSSEPIDAINCNQISYFQWPSIRRIAFRIRCFADSIPYINKITPINRLLEAMPLTYGTFLIQIERGCMENCSFCAIRFAIGRTKSKPISQIKRELEMGIDKGFRKFYLVGDEPGSWGVDLEGNPTLIDLLEMLSKNKNVDSIYLDFFAPTFLISYLDEFLKIISLGKLKVFGCSAQSGSNRILSLMNRDHTIEDYKYCIKKIKDNYPEILIRTQLMVGFPDETESDFFETLKLVYDLNFDYVDVFEYEDRPNTLASQMTNKIPKEIRRKRKRQLLRQYRYNLLFRSKLKKQNNFMRQS